MKSISLLYYLQILNTDPITSATTNADTHPTDGEMGTAAETGLGAGASAAKEVPAREKTVRITAIREIIVAALECVATIFVCGSDLEKRE